MSTRRKQKARRLDGFNKASFGELSDASIEDDAYLSGSGDNYVEEHRSTSERKRSRKSTKTDKNAPNKARTKASIIVLATDTLPDQESGNDKLSKLDGSILARIKKALALAQHAGTGEQEAKAAFRMASKLMSQHSITQADVLAQEDEGQRAKRAGMSVVSIKSSYDTSVRLEGWISSVAEAMTVFFDCKTYSTTFSGGERLEWTFYGLAEHTVAAAYAFEMAYNLILEWSLEAKAGHGRRQKNTYRSGVSDGLFALAHREKKQEKQKVIEMEKQQLEVTGKAEEEEDKRRLQRLDQPTARPEAPPQDKQGDRGRDAKVKLEVVDDEDHIPHLADPFLLWARAKSESEDSDNEPFANDAFADDMEYADDSGFQPDFDDDDDEIDLIDLDAAEPKYKPRPGRPKLEANDTTAGPSNGHLRGAQRQVKEEDAQWRSVHQLVVFRDTSVAIADDWLKAQNIKLGTARNPKSREFRDRKERQLYNQGREDAKKIDVRRKRIQGKDSF